jgi:dTDP-glucose 4,6-dehydratase
LQTILVTGGAGFIGSAVVRTLLAKTSDRVLNIDKLTYAGSRESLQDILEGARYEFVQADVADRRAMEAAFARYRPIAVLHLAAETHVDRSIGDPSVFIESNLVGTFTMLDVARAYWQRLPQAERSTFRFVHVSTDEVYGSLGATGRFDETSHYERMRPPRRGPII